MNPTLGLCCVSTLLVLLVFTEKPSGGERAGTIKFRHSSEPGGINCHISGHNCTYVLQACSWGSRTRGCNGLRVVLRRVVMSWHHCLGGLTVYSEMWAHVSRLGQTIWVLTAEDESPQSWERKKWEEGDTCTWSLENTHWSWLFFYMQLSQPSRCVLDQALV